MSILQFLLLFGVPVAGLFVFLTWRAKQPRKGWNKMSSASTPPASPNKVQQELAALARLSSALSKQRAAPASTTRPGAFNIPARWEIRYEDAYGEVTDRIIQVQHLNLKLMEIEAFCEMRQSERTFKIRNIKQATDPRTGARVDVKDYVEQVRWERRARR